MEPLLSKKRTSQSPSPPKPNPNLHLPLHPTQGCHLGIAIGPAYVLADGYPVACVTQMVTQAFSSQDQHFTLPCADVLYDTTPIQGQTGVGALVKQGI